jgi:MoaA/NifB/PqqE/SkfB family radical SAM enzyme
MSTAGPLGADYRVVQIHPTLHCNLRCLHCYSSSAPEQHDQLPLAGLQRAIEDLSQEGFNVASVSGGEPLLYRELPELLGTARQLGMITSVTTNGMLLTPSKVEALRETANLVAISLDGVPEAHNRMRAHPRAFELMTEKLSLLRDAQIPFGLIFTLTLYNLDELDWVTRFAVEQGATLLQVHPLEEAGRAESTLAQHAPDEMELAYAFVEVARLQKEFKGRLAIQYDTADREVLRQKPERAFAGEAQFDDAELRDIPLGTLVSPLVLEADGTIVPMQYGFAHHYSIANIRHGAVREQAARWKLTGYRDFLALCKAVHARIVASDSPYPFVNWYAAICAASRQVDGAGQTANAAPLAGGKSRD